jgi:hypothetical protein
MSRLLLQICTGLPALGPPPKPFVGFIILKLVGAPLFIYW